MTEKAFNKLMILTGGNIKPVLFNKLLFPGLHYSFIRNTYSYVSVDYRSTVHSYIHPEDAIRAAYAEGLL